MKLFAKIKNKYKSSINNQKEYSTIFKSKSLIGLIILSLFIFLFVVAIVQVPGFTTIHSYTFGLFFGYYSYFIYLGFIFYSLELIFKINLKIKMFVNKKFKRQIYYDWKMYFLFIIALSCLIESSIEINTYHDIFPGANSFKNFYQAWWKSFTSSNDPVLPNTMQNGGIIILIISSFLVCLTGCITTILLGILMLSYCGYYLVCGSIFKKIQLKIVSKRRSKKDFDQYNEKILDLNYEDQGAIENIPDSNLLNQQNTININNGEPVQTNLDSNNKKALKTQTQENVFFENPFLEEDKQDNKIIQQTTEFIVLNEENEADKKAKSKTKKEEKNPKFNEDFSNEFTKLIDANTKNKLAKEKSNKKNVSQIKTIKDTDTNAIFNLDSSEFEFDIDNYR